jgi:hypothetical protein
LDVAQLRATVSVDGVDQAERKLQSFSRSVKQTGDEATKAGTGTTRLGQGVGALNGALGQLGLATVGVSTVVALGTSAVNSANSLERVSTVVEHLTGSQAAYTEVLELARRQQDLFGGTLASNLEGLRGLIPMANAYGVELAAISQASQQLAASSPEQGIQGAA